MITQRFVYIHPILTQILNSCCSGPDPYFDSQYRLCFTEVDRTILSSGEALEAVLDAIADLADQNKIRRYVCSLPSDRKFLLYVAVQISFIHFNAASERLPLIPPKSYYSLLASYLWEGFASFTRLCLKQGTSVWEQVIDYESHVLFDKH